MQSNAASLKEVVCLFVYFAEKCFKNAHKVDDETVLKREDDSEDGAIESPETLFQTCKPNVDESANLPPTGSSTREASMRGL